MKRILAVGAICLALSACSGTPDAAVSPSVAVSGTGTPTPGVSDPAMDPLYLEAVEVYEAYLVEILKLERAGGAEELPPSVTSFLVGGSYEELLRDVYRDLLETGEHMAATPDPTLTVRPMPGVSLEGSDVAIEACVDASGVDRLNSAGRAVGNGALVQRQVHFQRGSDGELKILGMVAEEVVKCPF